jgi:hypothetical protein
MPKPYFIPGDGRGSSGSPREQEVTDGDQIRHGSILSNIARKRVLHGRWSPFTLPPKFPVRPHDYRGPRPRAQRYA